jgi:hypothetical protein
VAVDKMPPTRLVSRVPFDGKEPAVSLVKIIVITIAVILSILLFGRFLF